MKDDNLFRAHVGGFFRGLERKHVFRLVLILAASIGLVWFLISAMGRPMGALENVHGRLESAFTSPQGPRSPANRSVTSVTVRLENGAMVRADLPYGVSFIPDARVELAVATYDTGFGVGYRYTFIRYLEDDSERAK